MRSAPFFVAPHKPESEGVDFLGLRALNLTMMDRLVPGINNVVSMIRPFTVMSWVAWRFTQAVSARAAATVSTVEFEVFKQKVETVFVYSQVQAGDAVGLPGRQQKTPTGDVIRFQFSAFKRTGSILDAALYGPAIKSLSGLGFLAQHPDARFVVATVAGERLALALDASLRSCLTAEQYQFISSITQVQAPRALIDENFSRAWALADVSAEESEVFRGRFYQPQAIGSTGPDGRRATILEYVLALLRQEAAPQTVAQVRRLIACRFPKALMEHPHHEVFHQMQRYWQLLQVRQVQRLGLEALFGWTERALWDGATDIDQLAALACSQLGIEPGSVGDTRFIADQLAEFRSAGSDLESLFAAGTDASGELDIFTLGDRLETSMKKKPKETLRLAVRLLLLAARYGEAFKADPVTRGEVGAGASVRLPLGAWTQFVRNHEAQPLSQCIHKVLGSFIISQHLGVAAARASDEKSRMRISIEDRGLTSVLPGRAKALSPLRTADRLGSAMALMGQCGMLRIEPPQGREDPVRYGAAQHD